LCIITAFAAAIFFFTAFPVAVFFVLGGLVATNFITLLAVWLAFNYTKPSDDDRLKNEICKWLADQKVAGAMTFNEMAAGNVAATTKLQQALGDVKNNTAKLIAGMETFNLADIEKAAKEKLEQRLDASEAKKEEKKLKIARDSIGLMKTLTELSKLLDADGDVEDVLTILAAYNAILHGDCAEKMANEHKVLTNTTENIDCRNAILNSVGNIFKTLGIKPFPKPKMSAMLDVNKVSAKFLVEMRQWRRKKLGTAENKPPTSGK
jgi:hypothetical protein